MVDQLGTTSQDRLSVAPQDRVPPVPYTFTTPSGLEIDLRLFCRNSVKQAMPLLISILEKESRGWFLQFREGVVAELKKQEMDESDIETVWTSYFMFSFLLNQHFIIFSFPFHFGRTQYLKKKRKKMQENNSEPTNQAYVFVICQLSRIPSKSRFRTAVI